MISVSTANQVALGVDEQAVHVEQQRSGQRTRRQHSGGVAHLALK